VEQFSEVRHILHIIICVRRAGVRIGILSELNSAGFVVALLRDWTVGEPQASSNWVPDLDF
jgi:hypothetical protein